MRELADIYTLEYKDLSPREYMAELYLYLDAYGKQNGFATPEVDAMYMTIWSESAGRFNAQAKTSTASGAGQFIEKTSKNLIARTPDYSADIGIQHPYNQAVLTVALAREVLDKSEDNPYEVMGMGSFKALHKLGEPTFLSLVKATSNDAETALKDVLSDNAIKANKGTYLPAMINAEKSDYPDWKTGEFAQWANYIIGREDYMSAAVESLEIVYPDAVAEELEAKLKSSLNADVIFDLSYSPEVSSLPSSRPEALAAKFAAELASREEKSAPPSSAPEISQRPTARPELETETEVEESPMLFSALSHDDLVAGLHVLKEQDGGIPSLIDGANWGAVDNYASLTGSRIAGVAFLNGADGNIRYNRFEINSVDPNVLKEAVDCVRAKSGGHVLGAVESPSEAGKMDVVIRTEHGLDPQACSIEDLGIVTAGMKENDSSLGKG